MSNDVQKDGDRSRRDPLERRNKALGLSLAVMVVVLFVVTYFRIKGMTP